MTSSPALFPAVTVTVVRDRKIRTALRTIQIAGFVTVPSWKKINIDIARAFIISNLFNSSAPLFPATLGSDDGNKNVTKQKVLLTKQCCARALFKK